MLEIVDCIRSPTFCQCQYQTFPDSKRCIFCNSNVVSQTNTAFGVTCCAEKRFVRQEVRKRSRSVTLALHRHAAVCCGGSGVISWFCGLDSCKALHSVLLTIACTWLMDTSECCFEVHIITVWLSSHALSARRLVVFMLGNVALNHVRTGKKRALVY